MGWEVHVLHSRTGIPSHLWSPGKGNACMVVLEFNVRCLSELSHLQNPKKSDSSVLMVLWRKVMQIAHFTMGTTVLTFIKCLVIFIIEGVTLSCKSTFWRTELLLGCAVQIQSFGHEAVSQVSHGKPAGGQHLKLLLPHGCLLGLSSFPPLPFYCIEGQKSNWAIAWVCPIWLPTFKIR